MPYDVSNNEKIKNSTPFINIYCNVFIWGNYWKTFNTTIKGILIRSRFDLYKHYAMTSSYESTVLLIQMNATKISTYFISTLDKQQVTLNKSLSSSTRNSSKASRVTFSSAILLPNILAALKIHQIPHWIKERRLTKQTLINVEGIT